MLSRTFLLSRTLTQHLLVSALAVCAACSNADPDEKGSSGGTDGASGGSSGASGGGGSSGNVGSGGSSTAATGGTLQIDDDAGVGGGQNPTLTTPVNVIITADNAYGFGYGTGDELLNYAGGVENPDSSDIFDCPVGNGPEMYTVPATDANAGNFLYIISYADRSTTQGVIAKFFREGAEPVFTGNGAWEVCATGEDFDPGSGGPTLDEINEQIEICNAGNADPETTSAGWTDTAGTAGGKLAFGEDNGTERDDPEPGNEFKIACDIDAEARWMWFDWEPARTEGSPFIWPSGDGNVTKDFLIFRLGAEYVPEPPK